MAMRIASGLPDGTEVLMERLVHCALEVHRRLGPGYLERIYGVAYGIELTATGIPFERERPVAVRYRDAYIDGQRVDFIAAGQVVVELKAVASLDPIFYAKLISYLRSTGCRAGLLINFNTRLLKEGIKRVVL